MPKAIVESSRLPVCPHWEATMKSATVSATVSVIALGSAVFLSPAQADTYVLTTIIQVPPSTLNHQGGQFVNFDISFFDPLTQLDYVADRSNASVSIFSAQNNTFVGQAFGTPNFAGQLPPDPVGGPNSTSGPDGVQVVNIPGQHQVFAGDGPSTVYAFNISNQTTNPTVTQVGLPSANGNPLSTGGQFRADEMAYAPTTNTLLVANNADTPAFATLINAKTGAIIKGNITIPQGGNGGGLEASDFNPVTKTFFIAVPQLANIPGAKGGVAQIDPATGAILPINGQHRPQPSNTRSGRLRQLFAHGPRCSEKWSDVDRRRQHRPRQRGDHHRLNGKACRDISRDPRYRSSVVRPDHEPLVSCRKQ